MRTRIGDVALADPDIALSNDIIRNCVHCGTCLSHCPTYQVRHDENDSPRGRIVLIRNMYETGGAPDAKTVAHLDRCLTCLACEAICPSDVQYSKLIAHGREYVESRYRRPLVQRVIRHALSLLIPSRRLFRAALAAGKVFRPLRSAFGGTLRAMLEMTPAGPLPPASAVDRAQVFPARGVRRARVSLLNGCVQTVLDPAINEATIRLLQRHGVEVVVAAGAGCCGAPAEHMGLEDRALPLVKANIDAWLREADGPGGLDAIIVNTSGCGTSLKAYGHALRLDPDWRDKAARVSALAKDISEFMAALGLQAPVVPTALRVVYHAACSMQHGQRIVRPPLDLLRAAGFEVVEPPDSFMCCGSAGVYNLLQPAIAGELKQRKVAAIRSTHAEVAASGNIGCMTQLADAIAIPFVHTVQLLDWATGGPLPEALRDSAAIRPLHNAVDATVVTAHDE
ncbi:glycolate oxidase subunit GlcF [Burkholderia sp. Ac-20344]|uniref:glycolate oxidase subunit GlcF n=1 Tax=Burkholderia sp. Ac-20344 TaxID=2703890 RepID=UPI00197B6BAE|nr:glycolate oxidase subunit GlcF [Burkholderia sp. Ac-20344]MBN3830315.1 glycolate oxidase subunit GlcF [Burkholderia sp. Ac-20344]